MSSIAVGIGSLILAVMIALLSLVVGGFPVMLRFLSYLHFKHARFYLNAIQGIEKLETLDEKSTILGGNQRRIGRLKPSDVGFKEIMEVLRKKRMPTGEAEEIILEEVEILLGNFEGEEQVTPDMDSLVINLNSSGSPLFGHSLTGFLFPA